MTSDTQLSARRFWYEEEPGDPSRGLAVLEATRAFNAAESARRRRSEGAVRMSDNDLSAMRYLLRAAQEGRSVGPKELAEYLGIQSSSVTALLDRLERAGHIRREASPFDRRALIVVPVAPQDELQRAVLGELRGELVAVAASLDPEESRIVVDVLGRMSDAIDALDRRDAPA